MRGSKGYGPGEARGCVGEVEDVDADLDGEEGEEWNVDGTGIVMVKQLKQVALERECEGLW